MKSSKLIKEHEVAAVEQVVVVEEVVEQLEEDVAAGVVELRVEAVQGPEAGDQYRMSRLGVERDAQGVEAGVLEPQEEVEEELAEEEEEV